ncbi:MAG: glutamate--tRNA ligase [Candidatus Marsarchaeota archaeon]|jgi:glutamyl-tRNA synthetase|nr:glutamate--tRNA ligase [Candidatus Marsarchaeota archaeon]
MLNSEIKEEMKKIAVKNAIEYGKARQSAVISKILSKFPDLKANMKQLSEEAAEIVDRINSTDRRQLENDAERYAEEFKREDADRAERSAQHKFELEGADIGRFVTRFPPEPNGYMQIGHAKAAWIEREFTDKYKGRMALYFDDTNPEKEKQEFVDAIRRDMKWLGIAYDTEYFSSDNIDIMYSYAEKLIEGGKAYVCSCTADKIKEGRMQGTRCVHKRQKIEKNIKLWREMLNSNGGAEGMILRLNADLKDDNTTMRDPTLFRVKEGMHYRQGTKYSVWPTYFFNTPIVDSIKGITDVIRSKEFELVDELYFYILDCLGLRKPRVHSIARLEIKDNLTSKRKINDLIARGLLWGYDDPRLVTIAGLRRRGILPAAIKSFVMRFGMSKNDSEVSIEMLLAENRKLIDAISKHMFFVEKPVKVVVQGIPEDMRDIKIKLHPGTGMGYRRYRLSNTFFINMYDASKLTKGAQIRLKDAFSIVVRYLDGNQITAEYIKDGSGNDSAKVQWVNEGNYMACKIYEIKDLLAGDEFNSSSMIVKEGYIESHAESLDVGEVVQLERTGYFKLDNKDGFAFISL